VYLVGYVLPHYLNIIFFRQVAHCERCTCEIKSRIAIAKSAFKKKRALFTSKMDLEFRKKLVQCYIWTTALYGTETWTLRAVDQKHRESFEMWCWTRMEISWTDHVKNEVLPRVKEQRNILHEIRKRKANWIGHILRRHCLLRQVIQGEIKGGIGAVAYPRTFSGGGEFNKFS
jgi:hypothetical protein